MMTTITIGQALLILIKKYAHDPQKYDDLKRLYLTGCPKDDPRLDQYLKDTELMSYHLSRKSKDIHADPSRRYFESRLAFETLRHNLGDLKVEPLYFLFERFLSYHPGRHEYRNLLIDFFSTLEIPNHFFFNWFKKDFEECIRNIESLTDNQSFSPDEKEKILMLLKLRLLALTNARLLKLPMDIYKTHPFYIGKGNLSKGDQAHVRSSHLGIMKSFMALPIDDPCFSEKPSPALRPTDKNSFDLAALWPTTAFHLQVHPYVGSISGNMLCLLRSLLYSLLHERSFLFEIEMFTLFIRLFSSAFLLYCGGHSYYELLAPLRIEDVRKNFSLMEGFDELSMLDVLYRGNEEAFEKAISLAIQYNESYLRKKELLTEISLFKKQIADRDLVAKTIAEIDELFNRYQNFRKEYFLSSVKETLKKLVAQTKPKIFSCRTVMITLDKILNTLEQENTTYYGNLLFFASYRQETSTLSKLIGEARDIQERLLQQIKRKAPAETTLPSTEAVAI